MQVTDGQLESIVNKVVEKLSLSENVGDDKETKKLTATGAKVDKSSLGLFLDIESAIKSSEDAYHEYKNISWEQRKKIIKAIREATMDHIKEISRLGVEETGMGRYEDKIKKNYVAINKTPGIEDLVPMTFTGDHGLTLLERAPYGIIGSITPCTNPSETIIGNAIGMIAGGNSVVFNPHPLAKKTSHYTIDLLNKAVITMGGPPNLFTTVTNPTIESAQKLMKHPKIGLLVVTGGPNVVEHAMKSGKKVIAAGPGNPPVVVDETCDIEKAAKDIIQSAGTDNNIICVVEKEIIVVEKIADQFKKALIKNGAYELGGYLARRLEKIVAHNDAPNKKFVGKDIQYILKHIGIDIDPSKRIAITETDSRHSFARLEMLMPILPFIRARDVDQAIEIAYQLEGGCFHTAVIHSKNIDNMHKMAVKMNTSIFVKNGPALAGLGLDGEGPASFTIASPTGEGVTTARHFTRIRRCVVNGHFAIV